MLEQVVECKGRDRAHIVSCGYASHQISDGGGIVFAHSMGNNVLAGACLDQNKCVKWYAMHGSSY